MKKYFVLLASLLALAAVTACEKKPAPAPAAPATAPADATAPAAPADAAKPAEAPKKY